KVNRETNEGAIVQLRAYLAQGEFSLNDKLPPERELCEQLGIARSELRKAFAILEAEGAIWRHVGRGTFIGSGQGSQGVDAQTIAGIAKRTTPQEVMYARLVFEPTLAREAALNATAEHMEQMRDNCRRARTATSWRQYEAIDNELHSLVAQATRNTPLIAMYDQLNALRRTVAWGRLRQRMDQPPDDHHSFTEHEDLIDAIENRDTERALSAMKIHLRSVSGVLFPGP
ncbi:MAG: FCD domain-containing protein, partial [Granulosicoccus sp.]|nr:FCD domain-containing protein [Granulosicoccus sp.]